MTNSEIKSLSKDYITALPFKDGWANDMFETLRNPNLSEQEQNIITSNLLILATFFTNQGKSEKACDILCDIIYSETGDHKLIYEKAARLAIKLQDDDLVSEIIAKGREKFPDSIMLKTYAIRQLKKNGNFDEAFKMAKAAYEDNPKSETFAIEYAKLLIQDKAIEKAAQIIKPFLDKMRNKIKGTQKTPWHYHYFAALELSCKAAHEIAQGPSIIKGTLAERFQTENDVTNCVNLTINFMGRTNLDALEQEIRHTQTAREHIQSLFDS